MALTALEQRAVDEIVANTGMNKEIIWTRDGIGLDEWTARWREVGLRVVANHQGSGVARLLIGPFRFVVGDYDAAPLVAEMAQIETRVYRRMLRDVSGGQP